MNTWNDLVAQFELAKTEQEKFAKGNKTAGTRLRKHLQALVLAAKAARKEVQCLKNKSSQIG